MTFGKNAETVGQENALRNLSVTGCLAVAGVDTRAIEGEFDRIRSLGLEECEWRRLYHSEPPRISPDLLVLAIGYRHIEHGGLGKSTRRKLQTIARALRTTGWAGPTPLRAVWRPLMLRKK